MQFAANNYNPDATENNGLCIYTYELSSHVGPNLISYFVLPTIEQTYPSIDFINSLYQ